MSPTQQQVLASLSAGSGLSAAAAAAGVHRNTVTYWRRTAPEFQQALRQALSEKAAFWQEQAEDLAADAVDALRATLTDPATPAGVRLKAALFILQKVSTPPPDEIIVHKDAQIAQTGPLDETAPPPPLQRLSAPATTTYTRPDPKIGRNDSCPCGSGKKFKRCCLALTESHAAAVAA